MRNVERLKESEYLLLQNLSLALSVMRRTKKSKNMKRIERSGCELMMRLVLHCGVGCFPVTLVVFSGG